MFKKFSWLAYIMIMALCIMSLSGCGGSSDTVVYPDSNNNNGNNGNSTTSTSVVSVASPSFVRGESYRVYKGGTLSGVNGNPRIYIAPIYNPSASTQAALNLDFASTLSGDTVIITDENDTVVFAYNPKGTGNDTASTNVSFTGGTRMMYTGLTLTSNSVKTSTLEYDEDDVIEIVLNGSTAAEDGTTIPSNNYVWHADPDHASEYWTLGINGTTEFDEDEYLDAVSKTDNGVYIARDIRYTTSDLTFVSTQTAVKDEDTEYVVYYNQSKDAVADAIADIVSSKGSGYGGKYIFATLPMQSGGMMPGGNQNGGPNDGQNPGGQNGTNPPNNQNGNPPTLPGLKTSATTDTSITYASKMLHTAAEAYNNPVLHITEPGTYKISGKWHGQIWIDAGDDDDEDAKVTIILAGVEVSCDVGPALVFHDLYECGPDDEDEAASDWKTLGTDTVLDNAGARVIIANGTTNNFTGANVYRIMKLEPKKDATKVDGTDIGDQKKMYKMDGAFYSFVSMVIGLEKDATSGTLNVTSTTFEGLDAEMHMVIDSGTITVTAPDDGINVNEDDVSVFTMNGGILSIDSEGGDGIDSNGYVVINGGTLNIKAGSSKENSAGEAGIDAEKGTYISTSATYNWSASSGTNGGSGDGTNPPNGTQPESGDIVNPPSDGTNPPSDGTNNTTSVYADTAITTQYGTTDLSFGSSEVFVDDMAYIPRTVATSSSTFTLETNREVNDFSGITPAQ